MLEGLYEAILCVYFSGRLKQVAIDFGCLGECCTAVLL